MACPDCQPCNGSPIKEGAVTPVALFCDLTSTSGCKNPEVNWQIVCDATGAKFYAVNLVCDGVLPGTLTYYDLNLVAASPTLPIDVCGGGKLDVEIAIVCDDTLNDGTAIVQFLRIVVFNNVTGVLVSVTDRTLDGTAPYTIVGSIINCKGHGKQGIQTACVFDANGNFTNKYVTIDNSTIPPNFTLLGTHTLYTLSPGETLRDCASDKTVELVQLCDKHQLPCEPGNLIVDANWSLVGTSQLIGSDLYFSGGSTVIDGIAEQTVNSLNPLSVYQVNFTVSHAGAGGGTAFALCEVLNDLNVVVFTQVVNGTVATNINVPNLTNSNSFTLRFTDQTTNGFDLDLSISNISLTCVTPDPTYYYTRFIRKYCITCAGGTFQDVELDSTTPYTLLGTVVACDTTTQFTIEVLCDDNGSFLRTYLLEQSRVLAIFDTTLDGTTNYTTVGTVKNCGSTSNDYENIILCDDIGSFIRHYSYDIAGNVVTNDTTLDGITSYTTTGIVKVCSSSGGTKQILEQCICDDTLNDGTTIVPFLKLWSVDTNTNVVTLIGRFTYDYVPYVLVGSEADCDSFGVNIMEEVETPECYQWINGLVTEQVLAYIRLKADGTFLDWQVLSGNPPPDLTLANALTPCSQVITALATVFDGYNLTVASNGTTLHTFVTPTQTLSLGNLGGNVLRLTITTNPVATGNLIQYVMPNGVITLDAGSGYTFTAIQIDNLGSGQSTILLNGVTPGRV